MIGKLVRGGASLLMYFCLATIIAQGILAGYLAVTWQLNRDKVVQILALAQGIDLLEMKEKARQQREQIFPEQVSYEQIMQARAVKVHHLELREEALRDGLGQLLFEKGKLDDEKKGFELVKTSFDKQLLAMQEGAVAAGMEDLRTKLESLKPQQAKDLLARMIENDKMKDVVILVAAMPTTKSAKIMTEFKTAEDAQLLYEILRRIGEGQPDSELAQATLDKLQSPNPTGP